MESAAEEVCCVGPDESALAWIRCGNEEKFKEGFVQVEEEWSENDRRRIIEEAVVTSQRSLLQVLFRSWAQKRENEEMVKWTYEHADAQIRSDMVDIFFASRSGSKFEYCDRSLNKLVESDALTWKHKVNLGRHILSARSSKKESQYTYFGLSNLHSHTYHKSTLSFDLIVTVNRQSITREKLKKVVDSFMTKNLCKWVPQIFVNVYELAPLFIPEIQAALLSSPGKAHFAFIAHDIQQASPICDWSCLFKLMSNLTSPKYMNKFLDIVKQQVLKGKRMDGLFVKRYLELELRYTARDVGWMLEHSTLTDTLFDSLSSETIEHFLGQLINRKDAKSLSTALRLIPAKRLKLFSFEFVKRFLEDLLFRGGLQDKVVVLEIANILNATLGRIFTEERHSTFRTVLALLMQPKDLDPHTISPFIAFLLLKYFPADIDLDSIRFILNSVDITELNDEQIEEVAIAFLNHNILDLEIWKKLLALVNDYNFDIFAQNLLPKISNKATGSVIIKAFHHTMWDTLHPWEIYKRIAELLVQHTFPATIARTIFTKIFPVKFNEKWLNNWFLLKNRATILSCIHMEVHQLIRMVKFVLGNQQSRKMVEIGESILAGLLKNPSANQGFVKRFLSVFEYDKIPLPLVLIDKFFIGQWKMVHPKKLAFILTAIYHTNNNFERPVDKKTHLKICTIIQAKMPEMENFVDAAFAVVFDVYNILYEVKIQRFSSWNQSMTKGYLITHALKLAANLNPIERTTFITLLVKEYRDYLDAIHFKNCALIAIEQSLPEVFGCIPLEQITDAHRLSLFELALTKCSFAFIKQMHHQKLLAYLTPTFSRELFAFMKERRNEQYTQWILDNHSLRAHVKLISRALVLHWCKEFNIEMIQLYTSIFPEHSDSVATWGYVSALESDRSFEEFEHFKLALYKLLPSMERSHEQEGISPDGQVLVPPSNVIPTPLPLEVRFAEVQRYCSHLEKLGVVFNIERFNFVKKIDYSKLSGKILKIKKETDCLALFEFLQFLVVDLKSFLFEKESNFTILKKDLDVADEYTSKVLKLFGFILGTAFLQNIPLQLDMHKDFFRALTSTNDPTDFSSPMFFMKTGFYDSAPLRLVSMFTAVEIMQIIEGYPINNAHNKLVELVKLIVVEQKGCECEDWTKKLQQAASTYDHHKIQDLIRTLYTASRLPFGGAKALSQKGITLTIIHNPKRKLEDFLSEPDSILRRRWQTKEGSSFSKEINDFLNQILHDSL